MLKTVKSYRYGLKLSLDKVMPNDVFIICSGKNLKKSTLHTLHGTILCASMRNISRWKEGVSI